MSWRHSSRIAWAIHVVSPWPKTWRMVDKLSLSKYARKSRTSSSKSGFSKKKSSSKSAREEQVRPLHVLRCSRFSLKNDRPSLNARVLATRPMEQGFSWQSRPRGARKRLYRPQLLNPLENCCTRRRRHALPLPDRVN